MAKVIGSLLVIGLIVVGWSLSQVDGKLCPDKKSGCLYEETCCSDNEGSFACCPYINATCCSDRNHCCPLGTSCDMAHQRCVYNVVKPPTPWTIIYDSVKDEELVDTNAIGSGNNTELSRRVCPDNQVCNYEHTCCMMVNGIYGCCPFNDGVCCADRIHCCGRGMFCDPKTANCYRPHP